MLQVPAFFNNDFYKVVIIKHYDNGKPRSIGGRKVKGLLNIQGSMLIKDSLTTENV